MRITATVRMLHMAAILVERPNAGCEATQQHYYHRQTGSGQVHQHQWVTRYLCSYSGSRIRVRHVVVALRVSRGLPSSSQLVGHVGHVGQGRFLLCAFALEQGRKAWVLTTLLLAALPCPALPCPAWCAVRCRTEPTNDLDLQTVEVLEEQVRAFRGVVLTVR